MKIFLLIYYILHQCMVHGQNLTITNLYLMSSNGFLGTTRDGFLIATLNSGENTTICNYRFSEANANVACATLGYPRQGLSLSSVSNSYSGPVLIGDIACSGTETNINLCISSGRKVFGDPCSSHHLDVYLYCLQDKVTPQITTTVTTTCNGTNGNYNFKPIPNKINTGFLTVSGKYVCNDLYTFTVSDALYFCQLFCSNVNNPLQVMNVNGTPSTVNFVKIENRVDTPVTSCLASYIIALQCGPEPVIIEPTPNVTCDTQSIAATWLYSTLPIINPSLLTLVTCQSGYTIISNATFAAIVNITFANCTPAVTFTDNSIINSYTLTRSYQTSGVSSIAPRNFSISCTIPKPGSSNNNITFLSPSPSVLNSSTVIPVIMEFYSDSSFRSLMSPYTIFDNMLMYVKVNLVSSVKTLLLGLVNCKVATVKSMAETNSANSVNLITDSCSSTDPNYFVSLYPIDRKNIGFQFKPYIINGNNQLYVLCETTKCYIDTPDGNCLRCNRQGRRRKRSILNLDEIVLGPIYIVK